jgi:hypothetical protein
MGKILNELREKRDYLGDKPTKYATPSLIQKYRSVQKRRQKEKLTVVYIIPVLVGGYKQGFVLLLQNGGMWWELHILRE